MFCENCGNDLKGAAFCEFCGRPSENTRQPVNQNYPSENPYAQNTNPHQPANPYSNTQQPYNQPQSYNPYQPYSPKDADKDWWNPNRKKSITALVFGVISLIWSIFSLSMAPVFVDIGEALVFIIIFAFIPFGMALAGVLLAATLKVIDGHNRAFKIAALVLNSIALGLISLSLLIALLG